MKQLEDKGKTEIEKQGERGGKMTGKGEVSFPCSFLRDHKGALPAVSTARGNDPPLKNKHLQGKKITSTIHIDSEASPWSSPWKAADIHRTGDVKKQWIWSPSCGWSVSYLWSLLWPSDYGDPSDGQTGVILRVLLQDILWSSKGAILAQGTGDVSEGSGGWPLPSKRQSSLQLHCLPPDSTNTHMLNRNQVARVPQGP